MSLDYRLSSSYNDNTTNNERNNSSLPLLSVISSSPPPPLRSSRRPYYFGPTSGSTPSSSTTQRIHLNRRHRNRPEQNESNLDFTIQETNDGRIEVASVVWQSQAYVQGMRPCDEVLSVNEHIFDGRTTYSKAVGILYSSSTLDILTRTLRLSTTDASQYTWINPQTQRATSPPPSNYLDRGTDSIVKQQYEERTVTLSIRTPQLPVLGSSGRLSRRKEQRRLGLVIRGGQEYGLGIFISGIDKDSLSDEAGLKVGDQILEVNSTDFCNISHRDAVELLRTQNQLVVRVRKMNKLPMPRATENGSTLEKENNITNNENRPPLPSKRRLPSKRYLTTSATSNVTRQSTVRPHFHLITREEQEALSDVNYYLNSNFPNIGKGTLNEKLKMYLENKISVDQLLTSVLDHFEQTHTNGRSNLLSMLRKRIIRPNDFDRFDICVLKDDLKRLKAAVLFLYNLHMKSNWIHS